MESLIVGLILAAVTAITIVAYRHPSGYKKLLLPLIFFILLVEAGFVSWTMGVEKAELLLSDFIVREKITESRHAIDSISFNVPYLILISLAALSYFFLLSFLPLIVGSDDRSTPDDKWEN